MSKRKTVISLGSNLGDSAAMIADAAQRLADAPGIELLALSATYTSEPAVVEDQPLFKNAVALLETELPPFELLEVLQALEREFGRVREGEDYLPFGPRTLDLDIIDIEGVVMDDPRLTLPHPQALLRAFVVTPLLEISPFHVLANQKVVNSSAVDCGALVGQNTGGLLSICATPIGNLGDITLRVLETLGSADVIYCEDTRVTRKLLTRFELQTPLRRADAHKLPELLPDLLAQLEEGKHLAYVSDAGMPTISDPGGLLVAAVREAGYALEVLPGASALTTALAASGIKAHNHYFGGYFPRKSGAAKRLLDEVSQLQDTVLVFYESVHRVLKTLQLLASVLPARQVTMARELTKLHEEVLSGTAEELQDALSKRIASGRPLKGEVVVLIAPQGNSSGREGTL
ncbi:MAG: 16S rRNA (cytidine(1402)-2'-O)-methyltransferase [Coriobacteriales bacterium]|jgi:16S rRNA (cytidine1402-2'-O)-methyltransferase|nr:16S rRNA (cytidine(1402)-2'-O)-methyltransferase [Coriobacteriales bacterium]